MGCILNNIAVLGAGSWGTALAILLHKNGCKVNLWSIDEVDLDAMRKDHVNARYLPGISVPQEINIHSDLSKAIHNVDAILITVPSHAFQALLHSIKQYFTGDVRIVWGTKGLDENYGLLHTKVEQVFGRIPMAVLSGPSFAKEVAKGLPTAVTLASNQEQFAFDFASCLHNDTFRVYTSDDLIGVEISGAVKNVLAIAIGIADGMNFGANARAALITRGLAELTRLGLALGGKLETFMGLSGVGDLVLTCTDNQSRNRRFGLAIGSGIDMESAKKDINQVIEGISNTEAVYLLAKSKNIDMPITEQLYNILYKNLSPKDAVTSLLTRSRKAEF